MNITTRSAVLEDLQVLYDFEQGIVTAERPYDPTLKDGHINYYDLKELIKSEQAEVVVALADDEVVASGYAKIKEAKAYLKFEKYAYVGFMFVKPDYRGQGVSQKILQALQAWSISRGLTEMRLEVYGDNSKALSAYERYGFKKHMVEMRVEIK